MRKRPLMLIACVFLTGLAYQRYDIKVLVVVGLLLVLRECWIGRQTKNFKKAAGRSIFLLSAFFLGVFHMWQETEFRAAYMSKLKDGSRITVWGELIKWESTEYGYRGILSECYINFNEGTIPCNDIMVYTSSDQYKIGQIHKITGKVNMFSEARNQGNFDAKKYYQSMKIDFAVDEESSVIVGNDTSVLKSRLISMREKIGSVYENCMSEKSAGFYKAMVIGDKLELDENLKYLFLVGGISHILAISGLHVSILGRGIYRLLRLGGIRFSISGLCGGIVLIFYCIMTGNSTSTVRAVGMMLCFFLSQWIGRSYDMLNALGGMILFLLWENPFLMENSGFWFSVMALMGVGLIGTELSQKEEVKRKKISLKGIGMSIGITLSTLPVTALAYYEIPIYSPLVNFIVLPLLSPIFCCAIIGGVLGAVFQMYELVTILLLPCQWLLSFYEWICQIVEQLPGACVICGKPEWWQVVLYYGILFGGVYVLRILRRNEKKEDNRIRLNKNVVFPVLIVLCSLCIFFPKSKLFEITFLDVGQGDGIYICAGDGTSYFIDGGSSSVASVGEYRILPFLKAKGIDTIDFWFVSHCDKDHISGLMEILEKGYKIEHIVLHEQSSNEENYILLCKKAKERGIKIIHMDAGDKICSKDMEINCIFPVFEDGKTLGMNENDNSLILQVEWKRKGDNEGFLALFAGDISTEMEHILCDKKILEDVDLWKANHHGSNYSNSIEFIKTIQPEYIVISCGKNNLYGHPGIKAVERMETIEAELFYTMENGQVTFPLIQ